MITNKFQYQRVKSILKSFQATLDSHEFDSAHEQQWAKTAHQAIIVGEIQRLEFSVAEFEKLHGRENS